MAEEDEERVFPGSNNINQRRDKFALLSFHMDKPTIKGRFLSLNSSDLLRINVPRILKLLSHFPLKTSIEQRTRGLSLYAVSAENVPVCLTL